MIGIFDSGSGGLTVLKAVRDVMPSCDVLYFGDIKNAPYGSKSREELSKLTVEALRLLKERNVNSIVSACNSVSASLAISLFDAFSIAPNDLIEMVGPTVAYFKNSSTRIALCATPVTIASAIYQDAFRMISKEITAIAIPELAGTIEFGASDDEIRGVIKNAFLDLDFDSFDILILACTHYPLVEKIFKEIVPSSVLVFDPAVAVAERVKKQLWPREVGDGKTSFLISKDSSNFRDLVGRLFPNTAYSIEIV